MVAIVIPVYNAELYIEETVQSVLQQTHPLDEIILIDDGSSDNSLQIIQNLEKSSPLIKVYAQQNTGPAITRNRGVKYANSEWVCFADADDLLHPQRIEIAMLFTGKSDVVISDLTRFDDVKKLEFPEYSKSKIVKQSKLESKRSIIKTGFGLPNTLIKKSVYLSVGGINKDLVNNEDHEFHFRLLTKGIDPIKINCSLYFYRQHEGISRLTRSSNRISKTYDALYCMAEQITNLNPGLKSEAKIEIGNRIANNALKDAMAGNKDYKKHLDFAHSLNPNLTPYSKTYLNWLTSIFGFGKLEEFISIFYSNK